MRNLKRALSLALAAVMVIGMMVVGAGAVSFDDFSDKDEIVNEDAVAMVTELGIINGLPDGSFGPTQNIDRASFVKMVALALNGGSEPILPADNKVSYVDTKGTWAQQYIEFATNLGIVSGDGTTGKFNPTAPVTVSQAAKMLLVALGYNAEIEKYVGYEWQMNVDSAANLAGLYDGISGNTTANATRDQAAQLIYNALNATMVKYEYVISGVNATTSQATAKPQVTTNGMDSMLKAKFNVTALSCIVMSNEFASADDSTPDKKGYTTVQAYEYDKSSNSYSWETYAVKATTAADFIGKTVTIYVKGAAKNGVYGSIVGHPVVSKDNTIVTLNSDYATQAAMERALRDGGIKSVAKATVVYNYLSGYDYNKDGTREYNAKSDSDLISNNIYKLPSSNTGAMTQLYNRIIGNGIQVNIINNSKDETYVIVTEYTPGIVTAYNAKANNGDGYIYVKSLNTDTNKPSITGVKFDDVVGVEDLAKDDVVLFYEMDGAYYVEKAESVTVTPSAVKGANIVKEGSTTYEASDLSNNYDNGTPPTTSLSSTVTLGDEATLYLDKAGYVVYVSAEVAADEYMFITGVKATVDGVGDFASVTIKGVLSDGTTVTGTLNKLEGKTLAQATAAGSGTILAGKSSNEDIQNALNHQMFAYSVSGSSYNLKVRTNNASVTQLKNNTPSLGGVVANSKTLFLVQNQTTGNWSAYTGIANAPTIDTGNSEIFFGYSKDGTTANFVVAFNAKTTGDTSTGIYVLSGNIFKVKDGDSTVYSVEAVVDGEYTEQLVLSDYVSGTVIPAGFYGGKMLNSDKSVSIGQLSVPTATGDLVTYWNGEVIRTAGAPAGYNSALTVDGKTVVIAIDSEKYTATEVTKDEILFFSAGDTHNSIVVAVPGTTSSTLGHADVIYIIR